MRAFYHIALLSLASAVDVLPYGPGKIRRSDLQQVSTQSLILLIPMLDDSSLQVR